MKHVLSLSFMPRLGGRRKAFKIGVIATLAIAVGANIAVLGNLGVLFGRVVPGAAHQHVLQPYLRPMGVTSVPRAAWGVPPLVYSQLAKRLNGRAVTALYDKGKAIRGTALDSHSITYLETTPSLAQAFGLRPVAGRFLGSTDTLADAEPVIVVSSRLASRLFGNTRAAIGHYLPIRDTSRSNLGSGLTQKTRRYRIVGVFPADFVFPVKKPADVWIAMPQSVLRDPSSLPFTSALVRPLSGLSPQSVQAALGASYQATLSEYSSRVQTMLRFLKFAPRIASLGEQLYGPLAVHLELIEIAALLLALLVLVNLTGLATADALARRQEYALRGVLGARPWRLYRERLGELAGLALLGWAIGVGLGWLGRRALAAALGQAGAASALSIPVLGITLGGVLLFAALLATIGSLIDLRKPTALLAILGTGSRMSGGRGLTRALRVLIALQLAISVVLLVMAGNLRVNVAALSHQDLGFRPQGRYFFEASIPSNSSGKAPSSRTSPAAAKKWNTFTKQLAKRLDATPGVAAAAGLNGVLHWGDFTMLNASKTKLAAGKNATTASSVAVGVQPVTRGIVKALGLTVLAGDPVAIFTPSSNPAFIDSAFAKRLWPHAAPRTVIGESFYLEGSRRTIKAVVAPIHIFPYKPAPGMVFVKTGFLVGAGVEPIVVRSNLSARMLRRRVGAIVRSLNPEATIVKFKSGAQIVAAAYADRSQLGRVFGVLAVVALLIAAIGLFALLAYRSLVRRPEFAIRGALGATPGRLLRNVLGEAGALWIVGCIIGVPAAYGLSIVLAAYLPKLGLPAAWVAVAVVIALGVTALVAAFIPARRAAGTDLSGNLSA